MPDAGPATTDSLWAALARDADAAGRPTEASLFARLDDVEPAATPDLVTLCVDATAELDPVARAGVLCRVAGGWDLSGRADLAERSLLAALELDPGHLDAHLGLAHVRLPGPGYYELLDRLHEAMRPRTYLEIGMGDGSSMALARPGTRAVGVDPVPTLRHPIAAECLVVPQRSVDFLARPDLSRVFPLGPPDLVFIDGLHTFDAVLDDVIGVEHLSGPDTVVLVHDTIPLDEETQRPERVHAFWTGDVWKLLPTLADLRPDLDVATVLTSPSGLTVITGLDPSNRILARRRDEIVEHHRDLDPKDAVSRRGATLADDGSALLDHLAGRGLLRR